MIDVHLIGYTADLRHLVLDLDGGADGRYRLVVDADLFATVDQLRDERREAGLPVGDPEEYLTAEELAAWHAEEDDAPEAGAERDEVVRDDGADELAFDDTTGMWDRDDALFGAVDEREEPPPLEDPGPATVERISDTVRVVAPSPFAPSARDEPEPARGRAAEPAPSPAVADDAPPPPPTPEAEPAPEPEPDARPDPEPASAPALPPEPKVAAAEPKLSPAQIQTLLRAGRSPRAVAREAGTDVAWIERWLPPILAERTRILDRAQAKRLERPRLGRSRDPLGQAVARNLAAKGVPEDTLTWEAARRKDGRWKVSVRFTQRDKPRTATWTYDPTDDELKPASDLAHELGFSRSKSTTADEAPGKPARREAGQRGGRKAARTSGARTATSPAGEGTAAKRTTGGRTSGRPRR